LEERQFRNAMGNFATGVTVITTEVNGIAHGMTANAFISVSLNPKLVLVAIDKKAKMLGFIQQGQKFAVSILAKEQQTESMRFAGQVKEVPYEFEDFHNTPVVKDTLTTAVCNVHKEVEAGDHILIIGEVIHLRVNHGDPLIYFQGKYQELASKKESL
jgi:flavin reductase (DIM6/NTAB) family NADH-FMN oxidoreductase RutF